MNYYINYYYSMTEKMSTSEKFDKPKSPKKLPNININTSMSNMSPKCSKRRKINSYRQVNDSLNTDLMQKDNLNSVQKLNNTPIREKIYIKPIKILLNNPNFNTERKHISQCNLGDNNSQCSYKIKNYSISNNNDSLTMLNNQELKSQRNINSERKDRIKIGKLKKIFLVKKKHNEEIMNRIYGYPKNFRKKYEATKNKKNLYKLEKYQNKLINCLKNVTFTNDSVKHDLNQKLREIRHESQFIQPLPPIKIDIIYKHFTKKSDDEFFNNYNKRKVGFLHDYIYNKVQEEEKDEFEMEEDLINKLMKCKDVRKVKRNRSLDGLPLFIQKLFDPYKKTLDKLEKLYGVQLQ